MYIVVPEIILLTNKYKLCIRRLCGGILGRITWDSQEGKYWEEDYAEDQEYWKEVWHETGRNFGNCKNGSASRSYIVNLCSLLYYAKMSSVGSTPRRNHC